METDTNWELMSTLKSEFKEDLSILEIWDERVFDFDAYIQIKELEKTFDIKDEDDLFKKYNDIFLFKLEDKFIDEKSSDFVKGFFKKASEQPVMFLKNTKNCPDYAIVGIVSTSPYLKAFFDKLQIESNALIILYLKKVRLLENEWRLNI